MRIKELSNIEWKICSPVDENGDLSQVETYLNEHLNDNGLSKLLVSIERLSKMGPRGFTDSTVHEVDKANKIYQLRKGNHRFLYFHGAERKLILIACPHRKNGNKVDPKQVNRAIKIKQQYYESTDAGSIVFCEDE
jgi:hypothetical protein